MMDTKLTAKLKGIKQRLAYLSLLWFIVFVMAIGSAGFMTLTLYIAGSLVAWMIGICSLTYLVLDENK